MQMLCISECWFLLELLASTWWDMKNDPFNSIMRIGSIFKKLTKLLFQNVTWSIWLSIQNPKMFIFFFIFCSLIIGWFTNKIVHLMLCKSFFTSWMIFIIWCNCSWVKLLISLTVTGYRSSWSTSSSLTFRSITLLLITFFVLSSFIFHHGGNPCLE